MAALLALALLTSGVAVFQVWGLLRHRREPVFEDRRAASLWPLMTVALALVFWLLLVAVWLFQRIGQRTRAPWW